MQSRYGVVISQQGIPVDRAADYQKVTDSRWKFMEIHNEMMIDMEVMGVAFNEATPDDWLVKVYRHGLGHVASFEVFMQKETGIIGQGYDNEDVAALSRNQMKAAIWSDDEYIYINKRIQGIAGADVDGKMLRLRFYLRVFTFDIMQEYKAEPVPITLSNTLGKSPYGAKFLDANAGAKRINDTDFSSFTMNTDGKQIAIHQHGVAVADAASSYEIDIDHGLPYPPSFLISHIYTDKYIEFGASENIPYYKGKEFSTALVTVYMRGRNRDGVLTFSGIQSILGGWYGYVILKDPLELIA